MGLLKDVQVALLEGGDLGPILLKLRFLAAKLGSDPLEEWVKHESEGYPHDAELPEYRKIGVSYIADFSGPFGAGIKNAPIPPYLVQKFAGDSWSVYDVRQSIAGIEQLEKANSEESTLKIDASNLVLLLQGNVYQGYSCVSATGRMSAAALYEIKNSVRSRILELTLKIEKNVPVADMITISGQAADGIDQQVSTVNNITNQVVYGNLTNVENSGAGATISVSVTSNDKNGLIAALHRAGVDKADAESFATIVASEKPEDASQPFGPKAKKWIGSNLTKAVDGTWKVGIAVASKVLSDAAAQYYGLK